MLSLTSVMHYLHFSNEDLPCFLIQPLVVPVWVEILQLLGHPVVLPHPHGVVHCQARLFIGSGITLQKLVNIHIMQGNAIFPHLLENTFCPVFSECSRQSHILLLLLLQCLEEEVLYLRPVDSCMF